MTITNRHQRGLSICSAEYNQIFLSVLQDKGVDVMRWLQEAALDIEVMNRSDGFMLYEDVEGFFNRNVQTLDIPGLGLAIGERIDITSHGSLSFAVLSSPDYVEAFQVFRRFLKLRINFLKLDLVVTADEISFVFTVTEAMSEYTRRFYLECAMSGTHTFVAQLLKGKQFEPRCQFGFHVPEYQGQYTDRFGAQLKFGEKHTSFSVSRRVLNTVETKTNRSIYTLATQQCEAELEQMENAQNIVGRIKAMLYETTCSFPSQEQVAEQFAMSIRTLRRKLSDAGTTYQSILDSVRESLSKEYLVCTSWSVNEIADMVGYSEPNNFKRAFKRWTGCTPLEYRSGVQRDTSEAQVTHMSVG